MELVKDYAVVIEAISLAKSLGKEYSTNLFQDKEQVSKWINQERLYRYSEENTFLLLRKDPEFFTLFYLAPSLNHLSSVLKSFWVQHAGSSVVVHLITKDEESPIRATFLESGYFEYSTLVRMSRFHHEPDFTVKDEKNIKFATFEYCSQIEGLLKWHFDEIAEQLPDSSEILGWIERQNILIYELAGNVVGFIIFDLNGSTLHLRYWFVHPDYRDRKIGSLLFRHFIFAGRHTKRQLFWVRQDNENALKRYRHYGFAEEKMFNIVMTNKRKML